ncbi:MAG: glycosyltransferase family 87 protein [Candidatus Peribacteraceae bacterium]|nr:glycosyltransferase family 87 protein [Candidatus Peribacteraceae bacterium]
MSHTTHLHRVFGFARHCNSGGIGIRPIIVDAVSIVCLLLFLTIGLARFEEIRGASDLGVYRGIAMRAEEVDAGTRESVDSEYPPLVTGVFWLVNGVGSRHGDFARAWVVFVCFAAVLAWICLRRFGAEDAALAAAGLFLTTRFLGPQLVFGRYDILMTLALFLSWRAHVHKAYAESAGWLTFATALKAVPLLAFPLLFAATPRRRRLSLFIGAFVAGVISLLLPVAVLGVDGTVSNITFMLSYHGHRPVQLESLWSGLSFLYSALLFRKDPTGFSHMSFANFAPGSLPILAAKLLIGGAILFLLLKGYRSRKERGFGIPLVALMTWSVGVSPVLSPQYVLWMAPLLFAVLCDRILAGRAGGRVAVLFLLTVAVVSLTQWIFPLHYGAVIDQDPTAIIVLNLRNFLLPVIVYHLLVEGGYVRSIGSRLTIPPFRKFFLQYCVDSCAIATGVLLLVSVYPRLFPALDHAVWKSGEETGTVSAWQLSRDFPSDRLQFIASLTVPAFAQHRWFQLRVDDCLEGMTVNGFALPPEAAFCDGSGQGHTIDLAGFMHTGPNTIMIDVKNTGGPMGVHVTTLPTILIRLLLGTALMALLWYALQCYRMVRSLSLSLQAEGPKMFYTLRNIWSRFRSSAQDSWMISVGLKPSRFI